MEIKKEIKNIVLGIRFEKSFRALDISGAIIDEILRGVNSPFDANYFPSVQEINREKILFRHDTDFFIRLNIADFIFRFEITEKGVEKQLDWLKSKVIKFFVNDIFKKYDIKKITRIGILYTISLKEFGKINIHQKISKLVEKDSNKINTFDLKFTEKTPTEESITKKNINDYMNKIYVIKQNEKKDLELTFDYQHYFIPAIEDIIDSNTKDFIDDSYNYFGDKYLKWVEKIIKNE